MATPQPRKKQTAEETPKLKLLTVDEPEPAKAQKAIKKKAGKKAGKKKTARKPRKKTPRPKKKNGPKGRTSDDDVEERVEQVREWYNLGLLFSDIKERGYEAWGVSYRTMQNYLSRARQLNAEMMTRSNDELLEIAVNMLIRAGNDPKATPESQTKTAVKLAEITGASKEVKGNRGTQILNNVQGTQLPRSLPKVTMDQLKNMSNDQIAELYERSAEVTGRIMEGADE